jgi:hypothetical protein
MYQPESAVHTSYLHREQMSDRDDNFEIFTSLRFDHLLRKEAIGISQPIDAFYMLQYHYDRLLEAAQYFKWQKVLASTLATPDTFANAILTRLQRQKRDGHDLHMPYGVSCTSDVLSPRLLSLLLG